MVLYENSVKILKTAIAEELFTVAHVEFCELNTILELTIAMMLILSCQS